MHSFIFELYKNSVMTHDHHIYQISTEISMATICVYPLTQHELPHWKSVLSCCVDVTYIDIPSQESSEHHSNTCTTIIFHV